MDVKRDTPESRTDQKWTLNTKIEFVCWSNYTLVGQKDFKCEKDANNGPQWVPVPKTDQYEVPKCVFGNYFDFTHYL